jgi:peptide/nickel transport system substrate-binding protein
MKRGARLSRREFLQLGAGGLVGLTGLGLLAACGTPEGTPVRSIVATNVAEPKPTTSGALATGSTPAAPLAAAKVSPTPEAKIGLSLIGKLEGPEIILDPAKFPKKFGEAPILAELVKAGKLPPVEKRLPEEPLVVKPVHEIGKYGGTMRRGFTGPADYWNALRVAGGPDRVLYVDYTNKTVIPNIAKGWEISDNGRTITLFLRRGMRWSDGEPFTADDFVFWYEDMYQNKELVPTPSVLLSMDGKPGTMEKVDAYTIRWKFAGPYYLFIDQLTGSTPISSHAERGYIGMGSFAPAHYLKEFHPKYANKDDLGAKIKEGQFDNWANLFRFKNTWWLNPDLPVVTPWKTTSPANKATWVLDRNPYSIWVDTEGNQLPYIDKMSLGLAENLEVVNLRAIAGEYDFQARHMDIGKLPVFLENQQKGGYKLYLDPAENGADAAIFINLSFDADPEIAKWYNTTDFRRALSLGIERDQINETFWLGTGTPGSVAPAEASKYSPGPEYRTLWATYDPKKASEMLDKIGLDKKDSEGYRLRTDGKGRLRIEVMTLGGQFVQYTQIMEVIREQWKKIGIQADVVEVERSLAVKRCDGNEAQLNVWQNGGSEDLFTMPTYVFPSALANQSTMGPLYARWFQSNGQQGKEPPPRLRQIMEMWNKGQSVPEEERIKLGKEIWKIAIEDVYVIGIVGLGAAVMGVRIAKTNMGNMPSRQVNSDSWKIPFGSRPQSFYFKN